MLSKHLHLRHRPILPWPNRLLPLRQHLQRQRERRRHHDGHGAGTRNLDAGARVCRADVRRLRTGHHDSAACVRRADHSRRRRGRRAVLRDADGDRAGAPDYAAGVLRHDFDCEWRGAWDWGAGGRWGSDGGGGAAGGGWAGVWGWRDGVRGFLCAALVVEEFWCFGVSRGADIRSTGRITARDLITSYEK